MGLLTGHKSIGVKEDADCRKCGHHEKESLFHIFYECDDLVDVRRRDLDQTTHMLHILEKLRSEFSCTSAKV